MMVLVPDANVVTVCIYIRPSSHRHRQCCKRTAQRGYSGGMNDEEVEAPDEKQSVEVNSKAKKKEKHINLLG